MRRDTTMPISLLLILLYNLLTPRHSDAFSTSTISNMLRFFSSKHESRNVYRCQQRYKVLSLANVIVDTNIDIESGKTDTNNDTVETLQKSPTSTTSNLSPAAQWHKKRRNDMITKHSSQIIPLQLESHGLFVGLPLLLLSNILLAGMAILSSKLTMLQIAICAFFPGSMFSLWQLQITHDCLHGSLLPKKKINNNSSDINTEGTKSSNVMRKAKTQMFNWVVRHRAALHKYILFWGTMPSAFGYYLYLQYGHMTHHKSLGDESKSNLATVFDSSNKEFEDGDALFVAHRMKLKGEVGPKFKIQLPRIMKGSSSFDKNNEKTITMSISNTGLSYWKDNHPFRNALVFTTSFLLERIMLIWNDFVVACTGKNFFFPNKPKEFHEEVSRYCRTAVTVRLGLCFIAKSWKALFFLYLAETLWSIPPHPACAMFITNHGSKKAANDGGEACIPSSSTYAGKLYSLFTLGTNYHVEHHDFPTIPLHELWKLKKIAPEFYDDTQDLGKKDNVFAIMKKTFSKPEFYACMDAGINI